LAFDQHAFISYAHIDDQPLTPDQKGWVTQFHATLQTMLSQRLGEKARIWRDLKLDGNDVFAAEIVEQVARTAMLVSVLSPRYLRSDWCTRELREFLAAAARSGGVSVNNKSRFFKVVKTPVEDLTALPEVAQRTLGYEFFERSDDDGEPKELDPAFGDAARQQFLGKLSSLAWQMAKSLKMLAEQSAGAAAAPATDPNAATDTPRPLSVYLASCGRDLHTLRDQLTTELRVHGYEVLPREQLPPTVEALLPAAQALLERCALSIHLVGRSAGSIPDGPDAQSAAMIENDLAARCSRQHGLRRIIWLPDGVRGERGEQQAFIDALQSDAALQYGADLLRGDAEALKQAAHAALQHVVKAAAARASERAAAASDAAAQIVHVQMSEADRSAAVPLIKLLRAHGLQTTTPVFSGDAAELREANTQLIESCDALLLLYGAGDEVWKFHQLNELRKRGASAGRARTRADWICVAAPATDDKRLLQSLAEPNLIDASAGFTEAALQPLWASLAAPTPAP